LHNDWTYAQEYPSPDIRGPMPINAHPDSQFSSHVHNDWTYLQKTELVPAYMDDSGSGDGYTRDMPNQFSQERDDRLMNSLIKKYALEVVNDGKKTGNYFLNPEAARSVSLEVVRTHMKKRKRDANAFLDKRFPEVWNHFDVNKDGLVEVERMPQFLRYLLGNALEIGL